MPHNLVWKAEHNRIAAYSGAVAIGAIYPLEDQKPCRWRVWVSTSILPVGNVARSRELAQDEVARRFWRFVSEAGLAPAAAPHLEEPGDDINTIAMGRC